MVSSGCFMKLSALSREAEVGLAEATGDIRDRPRPEARTLGRHLQAVPQVGAALFHLVSQFAALDRRDQGVRELPPGGSLRFLQRLYVTLQDIRIGHGVGPPELLNDSRVQVRLQVRR